MEKYFFDQSLMLRTPAFSYQEYDLSTLATVIDTPFFRGAIYLANPVLYQILAGKSFKWDRLTAKEQLSLIKYYNRMSFRSTPFGAFSAFTNVEWGKSRQVKLLSTTDARLHLTIDQEAAIKLFQGQIEVFEDLYVETNPTIYHVAHEFRYIKSSLEDGSTQLSFVLESLEENPLLVRLISFCSTGHKRISNLIPFVIDYSQCSKETALDYLQFLINSQWLVSRLRPNITGADYIARLISERTNGEPGKDATLRQIYQKLNVGPAIDDQPLTELSGLIKDQIAGTGQIPGANVFYAGLENYSLGGIHEDWQIQLREVLTALSYLSLKTEHPSLTYFAQQFTQKFDQQKVPLLQALDPFIGVGYAELENDDSSPLLDRLSFKNKSRPVNASWTQVHQFILTKWLGQPLGDNGIQLSKNDLEGLPESEISSSSFAVLFRLVGEHQLFIEAITGSAAPALIGRFGLWSEKTAQTAQRLAKEEQISNPKMLFAEIAQLSDVHADNINRRPHLYDYEIPINAASTLPKDNQISPADLWVSVRGGKIILESLNHQKIVIPRLSSAYNYSRNDLALFRFLCDLQHQEIQVPALPDLEALFPGLPYYPRLSYENTIIGLAKWCLQPRELQPLLSKNQDEALRHLSELKLKLGLPDRIALIKHDQQLVINLKIREEAEFFLQTIHSTKQILIQEFLMPPDQSPVIDNLDRPMINQFVTFLYRKSETYNLQQVQVSGRTEIRQTEYILGSQWLYLKLYCSPAISNQLITKRIHPLIKKIKSKFKVTWFFVRYREDGYHIRLRVKSHEKYIGAIIQILKRGFTKDVRLHLIRQYQAETYHPEWERYGPDIMTLVEDLFSVSSDLIIYYLKSALRPDFNWPYYSLAFMSVNEMVRVFIPDITQQVAFLGEMAGRFYNEFSDDKQLGVDLNDKYRELKTQVKPILTDGAYYQRLKLTEQHEAFMTQLGQLSSYYVLQQGNRKRVLLADLIHMHLNRLFVDDQRKQELVIYHCLWKLKITELMSVGS